MSTSEQSGQFRSRHRRAWNGRIATAHTEHHATLSLIVQRKLRQISHFAPDIEPDLARIHTERNKGTKASRFHCFSATDTCMHGEGTTTSNRPICSTPATPQQTSSHMCAPTNTSTEKETNKLRKCFMDVLSSNEKVGMLNPWPVRSSSKRAVSKSSCRSTLPHYCHKHCGRTCDRPEGECFTPPFLEAP